jgi:16S rRNA (cytosine1402-N4)-methyltransferase
MKLAHVPVLVQEAMRLLRPEPRKRYLDGTLGGGGHTEKLLIESSPDGQVLGLDWDDEAIEAAQARLHGFGQRLIIRRASFASAKEILEEIGWHAVDGVILDLGVSSRQLESPERGFSFRGQSRLDMRMDRRQSLDAHQIVNTLAVRELERIFREYGEERHARRIALAIAEARKRQPIETVAVLAQLVTRAKGSARHRDHHPATQVFQALRIAVNRELEHLDRFLERGYEILSASGRMVIISFHSLEDARVKRAFRQWSRHCVCPPRTPVCRCGWERKAKLLTARPVTPSASEIRDNPRARSAKLRAVESI